MKTYETISTEDLFRKTFGHSKFVRFCEVKKMGQSFVLFLTEEAWSNGGLRTRELGQTPLVLAWVTNVSTSPDLYIEFSTEY